MRRELADQPGVALLQLLDREPVVVAGEVDEPEVARADDGDRRRVGGRRDRLLVEVDDAIAGPAREGDAGDRAADPGRRDHLGQERVHERRALRRDVALDDRRAAAHQVADHLAEALAVALEERRAQALAVVGQDDELVRPGRVLGRLHDGPDRRVDAVERLERLDPLRAAVVGELVVVREVRVDHVRPAVHLGDDQRGVHVAQEHVARGAHPGVLEARGASAAGCRTAGSAGPGTAP